MTRLSEPSNIPDHITVDLYFYLYNIPHKGACILSTKTITSYGNLTTAIVFLTVAPSGYGDKPSIFVDSCFHYSEKKLRVGWTLLGDKNIPNTGQAIPGHEIRFLSRLAALNNHQKSIINTYLLKIPPQQNILVNDNYN